MVKFWKKPPFIYLILNFLRGHNIPESWFCYPSPVTFELSIPPPQEKQSHKTIIHINNDPTVIKAQMKTNNGLNTSQLAKMKKYIPHVSLPWNLQGRSSLSKKFQLYFKNYDFVVMWNLGQFHLKLTFCK